MEEVSSQECVQGEILKQRCEDHQEWTHFTDKGYIRKWNQTTKQPPAHPTVDRHVAQKDLGARKTGRPKNCQKGHQPKHVPGEKILREQCKCADGPNAATDRGFAIWCGTQKEHQINRQ